LRSDPSEGIKTRSREDRSPEILQAVGKGSRGFERPASAATKSLLRRQGEPGAQFLDIGTGVGWPSLGMKQRRPALAAAGIEPQEPALKLARHNLADTGTATRTTLCQGRADALTETVAHDLVLVLSAFIQAL
jgi:methylase of polypeptide subunit release factors